MKKLKNSQRDFENEVIKILKNVRGVELTSNQVSKLVGINIRTAKKTLIKLKQKGLVVYRKKGSRMYFMIK